MWQPVRHASSRRPARGRRGWRIRVIEWSRVTPCGPLCQCSRNRWRSSTFSVAKPCTGDSKATVSEEMLHDEPVLLFAIALAIVICRPVVSSRRCASEIYGGIYAHAVSTLPSPSILAKGAWMCRPDTVSTGSRHSRILGTPRALHAFGSVNLERRHEFRWRGPKLEGGDWFDAVSAARRRPRHP